VYSVAVEDENAVTGATTFVEELDPQFEQVKIHPSADNKPVGRRKYNFCIDWLFPKKMLSGLAMTATAVTFVAMLGDPPPVGYVPAPQEMVLFEYKQSPGGPKPEVM
jgi:hypothetical protein